jgi:hypothetical protein
LSALTSDVRACEHKSEENQPTHFYCILLGFLALLVKKRFLAIAVDLTNAMSIIYACAVDVARKVDLRMRTTSWRDG